MRNLVLALAFASTLTSCGNLVKVTDDTIYSTPSSDYQNWLYVFDHAPTVEIKTLVTGHITGDVHKVLNPENPNINQLPDNGSPLPVSVFWIKHPVHGDILIDAGFDKSFHYTRKQNLSWGSRLYMKLSKYAAIQQENQHLQAHISKHGIEPKMILFTHIHHDHTAGLVSLHDTIPILMDKNETRGIGKLMVRGHFRGKKDIKYFDFDTSSAMSPFGQVIDILGDGSVWALSTPGHSPGHACYLVNRKEQPILIVGDAIMHQEAFDLGIESYATGKKYHTMTATSHQTIARFIQQYPDIKVYYSHDEYGIITN